jgi:hypothetical protein
MLIPLGPIWTDVRKKETNMRKLIIAIGLMGFAGTVAAAHAESLGRPCTDKPESAYLSIDALKAKVAEQGYETRSGEIKNACAEFYVLDKAGKKAELFLDPTSGVVVSGDEAKGETVEKADKDANENEANEHEDSD